MKLQTEIELFKSPFQINPQSAIFLCGSCFTDNIGEQFKKNGFSTSINPYGVLFNPVSIEKCLDNIVNERVFTASDFFISNELWNSYDLHSQFSSINLDESLKNINDTVIQQNIFLKQANFAFLTFGTSFVFEHVEGKRLVANCHKQASKLFSRNLLSVEQIKESIDKSIRHLKTINPTIKIVLTISPVRHWRDGAFQNQVSKSHLFTALYQIVSTNKAVYFPSYELVMDEMRDYRFYADDMLHINKLAIEYIWEKLVYVFFSKSSLEFTKEVQKIEKTLNHKPFNKQNSNYKDLLFKNIEKLISLEKKYRVNLITHRTQIQQKIDLLDQ